MWNNVNKVWREAWSRLPKRGGVQNKNMGKQ